MNDPMMDNPLPVPVEPMNSMPWSLGDTWTGLVLLMLLQVAFVAAVYFYKPLKTGQDFIIVFSELIFMIPALIILAVRRANYGLLGYRRFSRSYLGLGCGLVAVSYCITIINNLIFIRLGQGIQSDQIARILSTLSSPYPFIFTAVILAPVVEESFFRGFLFAGFRQRYGYQAAALLSSAIFAAAHFQLAVLIPTFILGYIFSYLYQKTNSILPGMLMHFLVNAFGIMIIFISMQSKHIIPP
jgi:membrane protease YdiL (CAAX protease family)